MIANQNKTKNYKLTVEKLCAEVAASDLHGVLSTPASARFFVEKGGE